MLIIAAFVVGIATEPLTDAPGIELGTPEQARIELATAVQNVAPDHVRITLAFTVATDAVNGTDIAVPIDIPRDAAITGMRLSLGDQTSVARLVWRDAARETYDRIVDVKHDPALLEWRGTNITHHQLVLRVFPVSASTPARVSIDIVAERVLAIPRAECRSMKSQFVRPQLGFGHQLGRKLSLIANPQRQAPSAMKPRSAKRDVKSFVPA